MEKNQSKLRDEVKRRCTPQNVAANQIGCTNIYLNMWLKGHRDLGENMIEKVNEWLSS